MFANFLYQNNSILAVLACASLIFLLGAAMQFATASMHHRLFWGISLLGISLSFILKARAGLVGFSVGMALFYFKAFGTPQLNKRSKYWLYGLAVLLAANLFWWKKDSSAGRLLVYKVSAPMLAENWLWGLGWGNFKAKYNLQQAAYFQLHNINSTEALLAGDSFYAFNDGWQLLLEIGLLRFCMLCILPGLFVWAFYKRSNVSLKVKPLFSGALAALLCILIASLFSYPFQVFGVQMLVCACLLTMLSCGGYGSNLFIRSLSIFLFVCILIFASYLVSNAWKHLKVNAANEEVFALEQAGFKKEALRQADSLLRIYPSNLRLLHTSAKIQFDLNNLLGAGEAVGKIKILWTNHETYKFSASVYEEQGKFQLAEQDLRTAVYMVPNRMGTRVALYQFYLRRGDTIRAIHWIQSVLNMPVKIPSQTTERLLQQAQRDLATINTTSLE